jgi:hypothetical protein
MTVTPGKRPITFGTDPFDASGMRLIDKDSIAGLPMGALVVVVEQQKGRDGKRRFVLCQKTLDGLWVPSSEEKTLHGDLGAMLRDQFELTHDSRPTQLDWLVPGSTWRRTTEWAVMEDVLYRNVAASRRGDGSDEGTIVRVSYPNSNERYALRRSFESAVARNTFTADGLLQPVWEQLNEDLVDYDEDDSWSNLLASSDVWNSRVRVYAVPPVPGSNTETLTNRLSSLGQSRECTGGHTPKWALAATLRARLNTSDRTVADLAAHLEVHVVTINRYLRGTTAPSSSKLHLLAEAFGTDTATLTQEAEALL